MSLKTKVFKNGRSQAVRIPVAFRLDVSEVLIERNEATGDLILRPLHKEIDWKKFFTELIAIPQRERDVFLPERGLMERDSEDDIF